MTTAAPPRIFDRPLALARLARALAKDAPDFLVARAADDFLDRLMTVKRAFPRSLDLGSPTPDFARAVVASGRPAPIRAGGLSGDLRADEEAIT